MLKRSPRRFVAALAAGFALLVASVASAAPKGGDGGTRTDSFTRFLAPAGRCPGQASERGTAAAQRHIMRCLVNWARRRIGLRPLRHSPELDRSARLKAVAIRRCGFSHTACGQPFALIFERVGYLRGSARVGENLEAGTHGYASPRYALAAWLHSEGHRHNLFEPGWRDLGVALISAPRLINGLKATVWVSQFGSPG